MGACSNCNANTLLQDKFCGDCGERLPYEIKTKKHQGATNKPATVAKTSSPFPIFLSWFILLFCFHSLFFIASIDFLEDISSDLSDLIMSEYGYDIAFGIIVIFQFLVTSICLWMLSLILRKVLHSYTAQTKNIWIANAVFGTITACLIYFGLHRFIDIHSMLNPFILFFLPAIFAASYLAYSSSSASDVP